MKVIGKLFNVLVIGFLVFSIINGVYIALPQEIQAQMSWYNTTLATINAVWSAFGGLGGGALLEFVKRAKQTSDEKYNLLADNYFKIEKAYKGLEQTIETTNSKIDILIKRVDKNSDLVEADLQAKLSNPLIDKKVEEIIKNAIGENDEK